MAVKGFAGGFCWKWVVFQWRGGCDGAERRFAVKEGRGLAWRSVWVTGLGDWFCGGWFVAAPQPENTPSGCYRPSAAVGSAKWPSSRLAVASGDYLRWGIWGEGAATRATRVSFC